MIATLPDLSFHYLLDTNILLHYTRGDLLAQWIEATYAIRTIATIPSICVVTAGAIRSLSLRLKWGAPKMLEMERLLGSFNIVSLDLPTLVEKYAEIDACSLTVGRRMGDNDVWIAAASHVTGARLLTTDRDFDHLDPIYLQHDWVDPRNQLPGTPQN